MKRLSIAIFLFNLVISHAQPYDTLTLNTCYDSLFRNYPITRQKELYTQISALKLKNLNTEYLPTLNFVAQASYQSDIPHLTLAINDPRFEELKTELAKSVPSLDQYKTYLEISQVIWDGGMIHSRKEIERSSSEAQLKSVETELYMAREKVNMIYFNLLFVRENEKILNTLKAELESRAKTIRSGVAAGAVLESNLAIIQAETMKVEQTILETQAQQKTLMMSLQELIHRPVTNNTMLEVPKYDITEASLDGTRPELQLFDLQVNNVDKNILLLKSIRRPKLFLFGQAGYGKPGLNMLSNSFDPYGLVGVRLNWTIYDWSQKRREIKMMEFQKEIIMSKKETYSMNQRIGMNTELNNIEKHKSILEKDQSIIQLRNSVSAIAASRFDNGSVNATDYLIEKDAEVQARINFNLHQLQLLQSQVNYLTISGKIR